MSIHARSASPAAVAMLILLERFLSAGLQAEEPPFDYFANSWALIGLKDYPQGTRISPDQEFVLDGEVRARLLLGPSLQPIPRTVVKTLWQGYLPVVQWALEPIRKVAWAPRQGFHGQDAHATGEFSDRLLAGPHGRRYTVRAFAAPLRTSLLPPVPKADVLYDGLRGGDNYVNVVQVNAPQPAGSERPGRLPAAAIQLTLAGKPVELEWERLPSGLLRGAAHGKTWVILPLPSSSTATPARWHQSTSPLLSGSLTFWIPFAPLEDDSGLIAQALQDPRGEETLARTAAFWNGLLAWGARIEVPEKKVQDTYRASLIYQFIGRDRGDVHAGEGFYDNLFLRDGSYQVWSLALAGYLAEARQSLEFFLRAQTPEGQFVTQAGQLDAHGYALWALAEHYRLTRDRRWLQTVYPQVRRAVEWLERNRVQEGPIGACFRRR